MILSSFNEFEALLQDTLNHFNNPLFHPANQVLELLEMKPSQGMEAVRQWLRAEIEAMKPDSAISADTPSRRYFEILKCRYLNSVSQEETAFQLGMTARNLRRIQKQAVSTLAQRIWDAHQSRPSPAGNSPELTLAEADPQPILQELEVLQRNSPGAVADLTESLKRIEEISQAALDHQQNELIIEKPKTQLSLPIHPAILDQILLSTIEQVGKRNPGYPIQLQAGLEEKLVEITITSIHNQPDLPYTTSPVILEMLNLVGGTQSIEQDQQYIEVCFRFPAIHKIPILLIDDNPDFFHLFHRYSRFTRFVVHSIREGAQLQTALTEFHPQIIILDVLLPDVDGWQLLIDLQNPMQGRWIPVVVCTALAQKELAYSLGARAYLPKPVTREDFLQTLEAILTV